jgi:hypothetical protein
MAIEIVSFPITNGDLTILKNMKVNGKDCPQHIMENKKCLKPPTSLGWGGNLLTFLTGPLTLWMLR